nr:OB-fold domain-containing protein [Phytohabitans suffuscus]
MRRLRQVPVPVPGLLLPLLGRPAAGRAQHRPGDRLVLLRRPAQPVPGHGTEPYIVVVVELEEGVRVVSNLMDCPLDEVAIGQPVEVYFQPLGDLSLPLFRPVPAVSDQG